MLSSLFQVASGLPIRNGDLHAYEIARMALRIQLEAQRYKIAHRPDLKLQLRIGINSGPCAAGSIAIQTDYFRHMFSNVVSIFAMLTL